MEAIKNICGLPADISNPNETNSEEKKERVLAPEEGYKVEGVVFFDDDFELILSEETGKVEICRDYTRRLTEQMYEEMEHLEADDSYDPIAEENHYPIDDLPF